LGHIVTNKFVVQKYKRFPPHLNSVSTLPCETYHSHFASEQQLKLWTKQATHGLWNSAGLKMPIHAQFYRPAICTSKVGQGYLVFDVRLGFSSGSVRARFEVSVYIG